VRRILDMENQVTALRTRNTELRSRVAELEQALDAALAALRDLRPTLPVLHRRETGDRYLR
jgi:MerR family transcriptional regulator/heat shock protein HspR